MPAYAYLCTIYAELGHNEEAEIEGAEVRRLASHFSLAELRTRLPYKDATVLERVLNAARQAGLQ
jgi:hypothetical protein